MNTTIPLLLDGLIIILLVVTIFTASVLSSRLKILRDSRKDFQEMIAKFDQATGRADNSVKSLLANAQRAGDDLQTRLDRARALRDELSMMIDSADSLARRLESASSSSRGSERERSAERQSASHSEPPLSAQPRTIPEPPPLAPDPRSKAERDLMRALGRKDSSS